MKKLLLVTACIYSNVEDYATVKFKSIFRRCCLCLFPGSNVHRFTISSIHNFCYTIYKEKTLCELQIIIKIHIFCLHVFKIKYDYPQRNFQNKSWNSILSLDVFFSSFTIVFIFLQLIQFWNDLDFNSVQTFLHLSYLLQRPYLTETLKTPECLQIKVPQRIKPQIEHCLWKLELVHLFHCDNVLHATIMLFGVILCKLSLSGAGSLFVSLDVLW